MYLLGNFGVELNTFAATITAPITSLMLGDITLQGFPFYAGNIKYHMNTPVPGRLRCDEFHGIALRYYDEDNVSKLLPFEPYETDIKEGNFAVEVICSMGNALGVEYLAERGYPLKPQGLCKAPRIFVPV